MARERHGRGKGAACYVWIGLYLFACLASLLASCKPALKKGTAFSNSTVRMRIRSRHANTTNAPPRTLTMLCGPKTTEQFRISTAVILYFLHCTVRIGKYKRLPGTANLYSADVTINAHKIPTGKHLKEILRRWFVRTGGECAWLRICELAGLDLSAVKSSCFKYSPCR